MWLKILNFLGLTTLGSYKKLLEEESKTMKSVDLTTHRINSFLLDKNKKCTLKPSDLDEQCIKLRQDIVDCNDVVNTYELIKLLTIRQRVVDTKIDTGKYLKDILESDLGVVFNTFDPINKLIKSPLLQSWTNDLKPLDLSLVISALRGCDITTNESIKEVVKLFRNDVVNLILPDKITTLEVYTYSTRNRYEIIELAWTMKIIGNVYSSHWVTHMLKAIKVVSKYHNDPYVRRYWKLVVKEFLSISNLQPYLYRLVFETKEIEERVNNLQVFISKGSDLVDDLHKKQLKLMTDYLAILHVRLDKANVNYKIIKDHKLTKVIEWKTKD